MKKVHLNVITKVPNEEGEKLIEQAIASKPKDDGRLSRRWFEEQNLRPPLDEDEEDLLNEDGTITLKEEHMDTILVSVTIPLKNIDSYVESVDEGTTVYTKSGLYYNVAEEIWEIDMYLEFLNMSWWDRRVNAFYSFFRRIKNKVKGNKPQQEINKE